MEKKIKDLTKEEQETNRNARRDENTTGRPKNACIGCPLRWANQCVPCFPFMPRGLYTRMMNVIGNNIVEV